MPDFSGARIVLNDGWPELRVDGKPFFVHGAAFDYFGLPRDLWAHSLDRYKELGINTIDLTIPWNWHETAEGEFDFDGHSNPRRDLRGLLRLIADRGFKLILHLGPQMPSTWRLAGYPEWLVNDPAYGMTAEQLADGDEPPVAAEFHRDADSAAAAWLGRDDFLRASEEWFRALGRELAPYDSHHTMLVDSPDSWGATTPHEVSGPLLFVIVGDDSSSVSAVGASDETAAPNLARYLNSLCAELAAGGVDALCLTASSDLPGAGLGSLTARFAEPVQDGAPQSAAAGFAGQWIYSPATAGDVAAPRATTLDAQDAESLMLLADALGQQSNVPALITAFHAGGNAEPDEDSPLNVDATATILGTRLLLGRGIGGIEYAPLQDSLTPAGYETPGVNRYANRDAALDMEGNSRTQAAAIERNGRLVKVWGERLASVHLWADLGIVDLRSEFGRVDIASAGAPAQEQETLWREQERRTLNQVMRVAELAGRTLEIVDPETQSVERLLRDRVLLLVAPKIVPGTEETLSARARQTLVEFVQRGGTLIAESAGPSDPGLTALWQALGASSQTTEGAADTIRRTYGAGAIIAWTRDFYSWVEPNESLAESRAHPAAGPAAQNLSRLIENAGAPPIIHNTGAAGAGDSLLVTEIVGQEAGGSRETLAANCRTRPLCASGLLSVTNLDSSHAQESDFDALAPSGAKAGGYQGTLNIHVAVPAGDSLLLPLDAPLCAAASSGKSCSDEIVSAGAELIGAEREKDVLELSFYAPMNAKLLVRLEKKPVKAELDDNSIDGQWSDVLHTFDVNILRGAAPDYIRVVKIYLKYTPHVEEKVVPEKHPPAAFDVSILNAVRLPLGNGPSLGSVPALILIPDDANKQGKEERLVLRTNNRGDGTVHFAARIQGPLIGSDFVRVDSGQMLFSYIKLMPDPLNPTEWPPDGRVSGELQLDSGKQEIHLPLAFQRIGSDGFLKYTFDFERNGSPDWVLEDAALRLFFSPGDGGRMLALFSKDSGENFVTTVGALRDRFLIGDDSNPRDFTFNRAYSAEWIDAGSANKAEGTAAANDEHPALAANTATSAGVRMSYEAPEVGPAGAAIEKSIRLLAPATVEATYRISLKSADSVTASMPAIQFVAVSSLPASGGDDRSTEFCWLAPGTQSNSDTSLVSARESNGGCERFVPGGASLFAPAGVTRLEIRTPGHASLDFDWTVGMLTLAMKSDSVLLELAVPLGPGHPAETVLRYTVRPAP